MRSYRRYISTIILSTIFSCQSKKYKEIVRYSHFDFKSQSFVIDRDSLDVFAESDSNALVIGMKNYVLIGYDYISDTNNLNSEKRKPISFTVITNSGDSVNTSVYRANKEKILNNKFKIDAINNSYSVNDINIIINKTYSQLLKKDSINRVINRRNILEFERVKNIAKNGYIDLSFSTYDIENAFKKSRRKYTYWYSGNDLMFRQGDKRFAFTTNGSSINSVSVFWENIDCPYGKYEELNNDRFISIDCTRSPLRIENNRQTIRIIY